MNKSYAFHGVDLYINGEKVDESAAVSAKAKVTHIRSNFSTTIWDTCTKPTKRQLRKWKKYVRQLWHQLKLNNNYLELIMPVVFEGRANVFTVNAQTVACTVNLVGVMGAGVAKEYKAHYISGLQ